MIMMLPFLTALISIWLALRGHRNGSVGVWLLTIVVFAVWAKYHMTDALPISF